MIFRVMAVLAWIALAGCGSQPAAKAPESRKGDVPPPAPPRIIQFYVTPKVSRDGQPAKLCYGVENADKLTLDPPVDHVWPSLSRCLDINPQTKSTYTLTATNAAGVTVKATAVASRGPDSARIIEITVNSFEIHAGEAFPFCVHAKNVVSWKLAPDVWRSPPDANGGCAVDHPAKTTTYHITAIGAMGETDENQVTAVVK